MLVIALVGVGIAGYVGYVLFPRFDLPPAVGVGLLALAAGAGVASFFSPCSFPLLLTLLAREARGRAGFGGAAPFAAWFSLGAALFLLLLGAVIGLGSRGLVGSVTFTSAAGIVIRIVVGLVLVVLGLIQLEVLPMTFHPVERWFRPVVEAQAQLRRRQPALGFAAFGFSYLLIGFG